MLGNVLGTGNGLLAVVGTCATLALALFLYHVFAPLVRGLWAEDPGLTSMALHHGGLVDPGLDERLHDAIAPPPGAVSVADLDAPDLFIPGVDALSPTLPPR